IYASLFSFWSLRHTKVIIGNVRGNFTIIALYLHFGSYSHSCHDPITLTAELLHLVYVALKILASFDDILVWSNLEIL
ncbi:MAG: hypothetical protein HXN41_11330, partial [Prevotella histicola]|nr:hypothetical protein [Prevotella histicola]